MRLLAFLLLFLLGCGASLEAANQRVAELTLRNETARQRAVRDFEQSHDTRVGPLPAAQTSRTCGNPGPLTITIEGTEITVVDVTCDDIIEGHPATGSTEDGRVVLLFPATAGVERFATANGEPTLVELRPETRERETVVYPGSCNLMPRPYVFDGQLQVFVGETEPPRITLTYPHVEVDHSCEDPVY